MTSHFPLGDQAVLVYSLNEQASLALAEAVRSANLPWLIDVVSAYASVAVYYDLVKTDYHGVVEWLRKLEEQGPRSNSSSQKNRLHLVPCCYEFQLDLNRVAKHTGLSFDEIIALHLQSQYTVYAIGFCPGFPYLGYLPEALCGVPRLQSPRKKVEGGSVGVTGRQTGIYTEARPGGWNLIGRTPLELVNVADCYFPIRSGDLVQFQRIDEAECGKLQGQRL